MMEEPKVRQTQHQEVPMSWIDRQFVKASGCGIVALALIFNAGAVLLGIIGLIFCKTPKAREQALVILIAGLILTIAGGILIALKML